MATRWMLRCVASAATVLAAAPVGAESGLRLVYPAAFQTIPAATYDVKGERVGDAHLLIERMSDGNVRLLSETGFDAGARSVLTADMAPIDAGRALRILRQESRSFDPEGRPLGVLSIDHVRAVASCVGPGGDAAEAQTLALPSGDRVANVPLNLLFLPLARGESKTVDFQIFLCRGGPRLLDFQAQVARHIGENGHKWVEIRYKPDFGTVGSLLLSALMPELSVWLDPSSSQPWLAHRVPLYSEGPEVLVIREDVPADQLTPKP